LVTTAIVLLTIAGAIGFIATALGSSLLLRHVGARRARRLDHEELWRTVENLCIGAGLPIPSLYIVDSEVANAFATGRDPSQASLVVTSGLLSLLTPRELKAVIAHELSHIGNYDTCLSTMLAAAVATLRFPRVVAGAIWEVVLSVMDTAEAENPLDVMVFVHPMMAPLFWMLCGILTIGYYVASSDMHEGLRIWRLLGVLTPLYVLFGAPAIATGLRRMISQEREFLADADAVLLTRDPDGLALALAKVGKAVAPGMKAGAASVHLYFVDPLPPSTSIWGKLHAVHPPVADRIAHLATMGDGVPPDELKAAEQAGSEYADRLYGGNARTRLQTGRLAVTDPSVAELADGVSGTKFRLTQAGIPLYRAADGWSPVIKHLGESAVIDVIGSEANFVRVTVDGLRGYISRGAPATRFDGLTRNV
jgi:heat shock protein HtpX